MDKVHRSASQSVAQLHTWARLSGITLLCISVNVHAVPAVDALPSGGNISAGSGSISSQGNQMLINQASDKLAINWSSYNIGANASVTYQQPSRQSVALNRVFSADPSQLYGRLNANGSVILINPNGIVVGPGANINVGAMILSTLNLSDSDFLSNNYHFTTPSADSLSTLTPKILTQGNINTSAGGYVHLIGHNIRNQGTISAPGGTVGLLAGDTVTLNLSSNSGLIPASLSAAANADAVINNSGTISADQGSIQLKAVNAGVSGNDINTNPLANTVVIDQSGSLNSAGGTILIDGGTTGIVQHSGTLSTVNANGLGGNISVLGDEVGLLANSQIDASGGQGGGTVLIGGNWQGQGPEHNASAVYMDPLARIRTDATNNGNGGQVVLWSNNYTGFYGTISAKAGSQGGDGGQVETSSHENLQANGIVDASSLLGKAGGWLLDPSNITIRTAQLGDHQIPITGEIYEPTTGTQYVDVASVTAALAAGNSVTIQTGVYDVNNSTTLGDINNQIGILTLSAPITPNLANANFSPTLTLRAGIALTLNSDISATGLGRLNVDLYSAATNLQTNATQVAGIIEANSSIRTNGGNLTFTTGLGTYITDDYVPGADAGQNKFITNGGELQFNAAPLSGTPAPGIASTADILIANPKGIFIDTACGAACTAGQVTFNGRVDSGDEYKFANVAGIKWDEAYEAALGQGGGCIAKPK